VYFGEAGQLDYGMSNVALTPQVTSAEAWHINADEMQAMIYYLPSGNSYKEETLWRSSDHDPVLIGLNLGS
jgi:predicted extracellular nuclease